MVPENIHTPTTEGIGNSGGVGVEDTGNSGGEGDWMINLVSRCPSIQYGFKYSSIDFFFSRGYGGVHNTHRNSRSGGGGGIFLVKKWKFQGGGGLTGNSLHGGGMDIFWNHTMTNPLLTVYSSIQY